MAELPSAFRVSSTPSSRPTGSIVTEPVPMMTMMAKRPPVLSGFTEKDYETVTIEGDLGDNVY